MIILVIVLEKKLREVENLNFYYWVVYKRFDKKNSNTINILTLKANS